MRAMCSLTVAGNIPLSTYATTATVACADVPGFTSHAVSPQVRCKLSIFLQHAIPTPHTASHPTIRARTETNTRRVQKLWERHPIHNNTPTLSWSLCLIPREENNRTFNKGLLTTSEGSLNCTSCAAWDKEHLRPLEPLLLRPKAAAPLLLDVQPFSRHSTHCNLLPHLIHTNATCASFGCGFVGLLLITIQHAKETTPMLHGAC
ncbi:unnamed protein product [Trypanosoma congolense IL3000]|uniref:WGS project CAEQ00000000 data, annotated contig 409 n=1 Tax=Trypanosoma congolense (strain IL3000) TaxID=1068625 RepID=F9WFN6_TRYCI|nr:unnamed protein product [Trypanosoma congolense IL3000]